MLRYFSIEPLHNCLVQIWSQPGQLTRSASPFCSYSNTPLFLFVFLSLLRQFRLSLFLYPIFSFPYLFRCFWRSSLLSFFNYFLSFHPLPISLEYPTDSLCFSFFAASFLAPPLSFCPFVFLSSFVSLFLALVASLSYRLLSFFPTFSNLSSAFISAKAGFVG